MRKSKGVVLMAVVLALTLCFKRVRREHEVTRGSGEISV